MVEREVLEVDALIVGGGPAGLAAAYRLRQLLDAAGESGRTIAVLEKGREIGSHTISGAVMDPRGLDELIPDWRERGAPIEGPVTEDHVHFLTAFGGFQLPIVPPPLRNEGNVVVSLNRMVRWLGGVVEEAGVDVFAGFDGRRMLVEDGCVVGVRTGDKGLDREGRPKPNHEPGIDIRAGVTILAEGVRGSLTKRLIAEMDLDSGANPQVYSIGVKELWQVEHQRSNTGRVIHTIGHPLSSHEFGGGFVYNMADGYVSIGLVVGLDYSDPALDPHNLFQAFKTHPRIRPILEGGRLLAYGAKAIPEGGYWALPRYHTGGCLIVGDSAGFLNSMRLKGVHLGIKSGILAADTAADAIVAGDFSSARLGRFRTLVEESWIRDELWTVRNFHQGFDGGLWAGIAHAGVQMATGGRGVRNRYPSVAGHERMKPSRTPDPDPPAFDQTLTFDKLTDVYHSGTAHDEDQPVHLVVTQPDICHTRCTGEFGNPCKHFCPASVYQMEPNVSGDLRLQINASNCVHCKTCDIMDPYQVIDWECPEGGGGPNYEAL